MKIIRENVRENNINVIDTKGRFSENLSEENYCFPFFSDVYVKEIRETFAVCYDL